MTETHYSSLENNSKSERILSEGWLLKDKRRWRKYKQVFFFFNSTLQYREHGGKSIVFTNAELIWYLLQFISALVQDEQAKFCPLFFMVADAILLLHMRNQISSLMCPELNSFYLDHFRDQLVVILLWCVLRIHWVLTYISDLWLTHVLQRQSDAENFRAQILRCCIPHLGSAFWGAIISRLLSRLHLLWYSTFTETIVLSPLRTPDIFPADALRYALL